MRTDVIPSPSPRDEETVRRGFWRKFAKVAAAIPFSGDVLALYFAARDPLTPKKTKGLMAAALAYFVLPTDAIPDVFAGVGFTDDAAVIAAVLALAGSAIKTQHRALARATLDRMTKD
jgi:uncharacterized membrane protein YkvA (DUF1232 family)